MSSSQLENIDIQNVEVSLNRFVQVLTSLEKEKLKVKEKEDLLLKSHELYFKNKQYILCNISTQYDISTISRILYFLTVKECENIRGGKKVSKFSMSDLFITFLRDISDKFNLIEEHDIINTNNESFLLDAMLRLAANSNFSKLIGCMDMWGSVFARIPKLAANQTVLSKYLKIGEWMIQSLDETPSAINWENQISSALESLFKNDVYRTIGDSRASSSTLIDFLCTVIKKYGTKMRDVLNDMLLPIFNEYACSRKLTIDDADSAGIKSLWHFSFLYLSLVFPDMRASILSKEVVLSSCREIFISSMRMLSRFCTNRPNFVLSPVQIETLAKLVVLTEFDSQEHNNFELSMCESQTSFVAKRSKYSSPLEMLMNLESDKEDGQRGPKISSDYQHNCLLILHEIVIKYKFCLSDPTYKRIALVIWNTRKRISDNSRSMYCSVLKELVIREGFGNYQFVKSESLQNTNPLEDPRVRIKNLWGYALSCTNLDGALDQAILLMSKLSEKYSSIIGETSVISANVHNTLNKSVSQKSLELLKSFLMSIDFDELSCFSGAIDPSAGIVKWKLRCQYIEWLIKIHHTDISEMLVLLCSLYPSDVQPLKSFFPKNNKKPSIEKDFLSDLAILTEIQQPSFPRIEHKPNPILYDVLEYCIDILQDSWYNCEQQNRSALWNTILHLMTEIKMRDNSLFPMFGGLLESVNEYLVDISINGSIEELKKLMPMQGAIYLSTEALREVAKVAVNVPHFFAAFHLSVTNVPATYLVPILEHLVLSDYMDRTSHFFSSLMHRLEKFAGEVDFLPDILFIVAKFGYLLTREVNLVLLNRALEIHLEDKTTATDDVKLEYDRLCLVEIGILFKWPKIVEVLDAEDFQKKSLFETIILNIDMCELPSAFLRALLDISSKSILILRHLVMHILKNGSLWMEHIHVLTFILKSSQLTQVMMDHISEFEDVFNFHAFSIARNSFELPKENFFHSRYLSFSSNSAVKKKNCMDISCFPQCLLLNHESWPDVVSLFWSQVNKHAHKLLVSLRSQASTHLKLKMENRFICLLEALTADFQGLGLTKAVKKPFQIIIRTLLVSCVRSLIERDCSVQHFKKCISRVVTIDKNVFGEEESLTMMLCTDFIRREHELFVFFEEIQGRMKEICLAEADIFLNSSEPYKNFPFLMSPCFWDCVSSLLSSNRNLKNVFENIRSSQLNHILLLWELCPRIRKAMTPIVYIFGNEKSQLTSIRTSGKEPQQLLITFLRFYCGLIVNDIDRTEWEWNAFALSVLSSKGLGSVHLLYPITNKIDGFTHSNVENNSILQLSHQLVRLAMKSWKNSPILPLVEFCDMYSIYMNGFSYLICPFLCPTNSKVEFGQQILNFMLSIPQPDCTNQENLRVMRTFCECIDSCGLATVESLSFKSDSYITVGEYFCRTGFYDHAYAIANIAFDKELGKERALVALEGVPELPKLHALLLEIYVATDQVAALDSLPVWAQNDPRAQQMRIKDSCRWPRVASDPYSSLDDIVFAQWFCGMESSVKDEESQYLQFLLRNEFEKSSFPKSFNSHWKRIYGLVFLRWLGYDSVEAVVKPIADHLSTQTVIDIRTSKLLRDIYVLRLPFESVMLDEWTIEQKCLSVVHGFNCLTSSPDENKVAFARSVLEVVLALVKKLTNIEAHSAALNCLSNWLKLFSNDVRQNQILVEQCKVQVAMGDYYLAQFKLKEIAKDTLATTVAVEVMCVLSSIYADDLKNLDGGIRTMRDLIDSIPQGSKQTTYSTAYQQLYNLLVRKLSDLEGFMDSSTAKLKKEAVAEWKRQLNPSSTTLNDKQKRIVGQELKCEEEEILRMDKDLRQTVNLTVNSGLKLLKSVSPADNTSPCTNTKEVIQILFPLLDIIFRYENIPEVSDALRMYAVDFSPSVWLPAFPHIVSHCFKDDSLSVVIQDMIVKLIVAYPYHVLHTFLAYKYDAERNSPNSDKVKKLLMFSMKRAKDSSALKKVLQDVSNAHTVYRSFNWLKIEDTDHFRPVTVSGGKTQYALTSQVSLLENLKSLLVNLPLPTVAQPVGRAEDYSTDSFVKWVEIDSVVDKADGLSAPKILRVRGSDNVWYKMVWKKGEDVRQDSLVEHLFEVINVLIDSNQPLRTYKVIPLDSQSGIIEFCKGTKSIKDILVGPNLRSGLHSKIYPEEDPSTARMRLAQASKNRAWPPSVDEYKSILRNVTPVFRHHFYDNFSSVKEWSKMINNYTQSVAEWSIVCYVIGLGDRHASNVLFEEETSNLVHIDLGMILEFGKRILQMPERVPFRLTRDLLDPILIQGTHGNLLNRATYTMEKIRKHKEVILGVASVFLRETMGHFRDSSDGNKPSFMSATAIKRLKDKLEGTDRSVSSVTSHIQVQRLMAEATNIENLSKLFAGWLSFI
ncbi:unnamed protein product [Auanema sp. JU1783]|nr:unnamed protein product [Auanema sp. JU1783]